MLLLLLSLLLALLVVALVVALAVMVLLLVAVGQCFKMTDTRASLTELLGPSTALRSRTWSSNVMGVVMVPLLWVLERLSESRKDR